MMSGFSLGSAYSSATCWILTIPTPGHSAKTSTQLIRSRAAYKLSARPEQRLLFLGQLFQLRELY